MTYSYTQISQYLSCPRRYRHRYLDGWKEKDTRAAMLFGRAFEQALSAYFHRDDPASSAVSRMGRPQGQQARVFERDDLGPHAAAGHPVARALCSGRPHPHPPAPEEPADQVHTVSSEGQRLCRLRRCHRTPGRHPLPAGVEDHFQSLSGRTARTADAGPAAGLLLLDHRHLRTSPRSCSSANDWSRSSTSAPPSPTNSARSSASWSTTRSDGSSRPSSCRTAASAFRRTLAPAARTWASVWGRQELVEATLVRRPGDRPWLA